MNAELYRRARAVFVRAIELDAGERAAFVDAECRNDRDLHREVGSLLAAHASERGFDSLARTGGPPRDTPPLEARRFPEEIGGYRILGVLGEGGMGVVYLAEQENPRRTVALKVLHSGLSSPARIKRFEHEAQILGRLHHPGIAQVYEAGTADTGSGPQPFLAMELVDGKPLVEHAAAEGLGVRERLELLARICRAAHHVHERGVIHRDLKPANILVDEHGVPKILDFGIARARPEDLKARTLVTGAGEILGTLPYMSPEQLGADPNDVDARADAYALGVIGYELLSGRLPIDLSGKSLPDAARAIREDEPELLGVRVRSLRGDVETIFAKALEKERGRRYGSALELASDLERWLLEQPIGARPPSTMYQLTKFARRNRLLVGGVAAVLVTLSLGIVGTASQAARAGRERDAAVLSEQTALAATRAAQANERIATQKANDVLSLSAIQDLKDLEDRADALWPAEPELAPKYEEWLSDARRLMEGQPAGPEKSEKRRPSLAEHEAKLAEIRQRAKPLAPEEFEDGEDRWWHAQLSKLVSDLKSFTDAEAGGLFSSGTSEKHGWGIVRRAEFARTIRERSVEGPQAGALWAGALRAIESSAKYAGLKLSPQLGLLPIGPDPESGLWEFAHLETGEPAERGADGKLIPKESMGLVFVLLPGGRFRMGAQRTDPKGPNYDPQAIAGESPVHEVRLSPYFLSKYEMTQGQWERFTGQNPSQYGPTMIVSGNSFDRLHPVEQVTWTQCMEVMSRLSLTLPSEAQWEYACRGGTDTAWWTGADRESLRGKVNLADRSAMKGGATWADIQDWPDLEDGWALHAAVGSFPANPFGLHEVHGNVWEWCLDGYDDAFYGRSPEVDPIAPAVDVAAHVLRGGGFDFAAKDARAAARLGNTTDGRTNDLGLRPARALRP